MSFDQPTTGNCLEPSIASATRQNLPAAADPCPWNTATQIDAAHGCCEDPCDEDCERWDGMS